MLDLGGHSLTFVGAPNVHWPEVLFSYEATDKVLFIMPVLLFSCYYASFHNK